MVGKIRKYLELIRFSHTLFAMPFALLAAAMAWFGDGISPTLPFRVWDWVGILVCMVFARAAAMAFNRVVDRKIDALNPRTKNRHLPAGKITTAQAVGFTGVCALGFLAGTCCFLPRNPIPVVFAVPVLLFLFGYSFAKRFTWLVHFWLGGALMLAPIAAWVAIRGEVLLPYLLSGTFAFPTMEYSPLVLALGVAFWTAGFDMIYACMDVEFDQTHRVFSVPGCFGIRAALRLAAVCHAVVVGILACLPWVYPPFGRLWWGGCGVIAILLIYEHSVVDVRDPGKVNVAFFHVNAIISGTLLAVGLGDLFF
ncbi:MAG: 4-hydroxybenzoate octaprenyltransferase [Planctomycetia bacterium]|nr:4-hydroxybenzoate octaprenyltransferase [Planctomycetia bacterium]